MVRFQTGVRDFSLLHNIQTVFGAQPAFYTGLIGLLSRAESGGGVNLPLFRACQFSFTVYGLPFGRKKVVSVSGAEATRICLHGLYRDSLTFYGKESIFSRIPAEKFVVLESLQKSTRSLILHSVCNTGCIKKQEKQCVHGQQSLSTALVSVQYWPISSAC